MLMWEYAAAEVEKDIKEGLEGRTVLTIGISMKKLGSVSLRTNGTQEVGYANPSRNGKATTPKRGENVNQGKGD